MAFRLGNLKNDAPVYEGAQTGDGSFAVMIVSNAAETEEPDVDKEDEEALRNEVHDGLIRYFADNK